MNRACMDRQLNGKHLRLRSPQPGDAAWAFERWTQDEVLHRHLGWKAHVSREQTEQQLAWDDARWLKRSAWTWMIVPHGERGPVGVVQLVPQQFEGPPHHVRLGFLLARPWQRRGWMREAVALVLVHALEQPSVWRVDALCDVENQASRAVMEGVGMRNEGRMNCVLRLPNAGEAPRDAWLYSLTKRDLAIAEAEAA